MSIKNRIAATAVLADLINNPPTHTVSRQTYYDVSLGNNPSWLKFDTPTRYGVQINAGHDALGSAVIRVSFQYRTYGNREDWGATATGIGPFPVRTVKVGIRKIVDDSYLLIAEYPVEYHPLREGIIQSATVGGVLTYDLVAGDHVTFETEADSNAGIELAVNTDETYPTNSQSQIYDEGWANTTDDHPLAVSITSKVLTPI
jgi:hypothetical protein